MEPRDLQVVNETNMKEGNNECGAIWKEQWLNEQEMGNRPEQKKVRMDENGEKEQSRDLRVYGS